MPSKHNDAHRSLIGKRLGDYIVEKLVGKGGMGTVFLARHRPRGRRVATKVLDERFQNDQHMVSRFQREEEALRRVQGHPNVVRSYGLHTCGRTKFLVMDYVKGETLRSVMRQRTFSPSEAMAILGPIMSALHAAHVAGIVVRDVKPENIIIGKVPTLVDLGIAKLSDPFDDPAEAKTALTKHDDVLGTPEYISPEQARNSAGVDRRADIFSTACVLFEMLVGKKAFPHGTHLLVTGSWVPPEPLHVLKPDVGQRFGEVVTGGLSPNPDDRPETIEEFSNQLNEALDPATVPPRRLQPLVIEASTVDGQPRVRVAIELELNKPLSLTLCLKQESSHAPIARFLVEFNALFDPPYFTGRGKHLTVEFQRASLTFKSYPKPILLESAGTPHRDDVVLDSGNRFAAVEYWSAGFQKNGKRYVVELSYENPVRIRIYENAVISRARSKKKKPLLEFLLTRKPGAHSERRPDKQTRPPKSFLEIGGPSNG